MKVVLLGSGNVASNLGVALKKAGHQLIQVYNHRLDGAKQLAEKLNCQASDELNELDSSADIYILSVKDDAIGALVNQFELKDKLLVHTAGSVPMEVLQPASVRYGVLYPLQTFSKNRILDFHSIPFFIEASDKQSLNLIYEFVKSISASVAETNFEQRKILHLSAVFACNFVNHLYDLSNNLLKEYDLSFEALKPLILETAVKVQSIDPHQAQTGPARRNDEQIMASHLQLLANNEHLKSIYKLLSTSVVKSFY